jgi:leader peptidase (prepilin peptidase)/N-methyltransferase
MSYPLPALILGSALLLLVAGWDIARRRIPNWANAALGATGVGAQALLHGGWSVLSALGAAALVLVLLWKPWTKRLLGGGDVKAMICAATWLGLRYVPMYLLGAALAVGALAVLSYAFSARLVRQEIRQNLKLAAMRVMPDAPIRSGNGRVSVPFGAGACAAALAVLWWV